MKPLHIPVPLGSRDLHRIRPQLLRAGVDFLDYKKQVEMAMNAGANGDLGGWELCKKYCLQMTGKSGKCLPRAMRSRVLFNDWTKPEPQEIVCPANLPSLTMLLIRTHPGVRSS